jgi:Cu(I)/Ag(I) efflux system protein CusF
MKTQTLRLSMLLAVGLPVLAAEPAGHAMEGMDMGGMHTKPQTDTTYQGKGVIKALDAGKGTVTISHDPVKAINWPAMTMPFQIAPDLAKELKAGQKVEFEFAARDTARTVTKIRVLP